MSKVVALVAGDKFRVEMERTGRRIVLRLIGAIEDLDKQVLLKAISGASAGHSIQFDLGYVSRINSRGIREWLLFLQQIPAGVQTSFIQVNEVLFSLANEIPGMFGQGTVESLLVPYFCDSCTKNIPVAVAVGELVKVQGDMVAPEKKCPACSEKIRVDVEPRYFRSLSK